ncbi:MAG: hypothetical protein QM731_05140 [Chitinophagaceae bacterium]
MKRLQIGFTAIIAILSMSFSFIPRSATVANMLAVQNGCWASISLRLSSPVYTAVLTVADGIMQVSTSPVATTDDPSIVLLNKDKFPSQSVDVTITSALVSSGTVVAASGLKDPVVDCIPPYKILCCYEVRFNKVVAVIFKRLTPP